MVWYGRARHGAIRYGKGFFIGSDPWHIAVVFEYKFAPALLSPDPWSTKTAYPSLKREST